MLKELMETVRGGTSFCLSDFALKVKSCERLRSRLMRPGPWRVLRAKPAGRALTTPSPLLSAPVVTVTGLPEYRESAAPRVNRLVKCDEPRRSNLWRRSLSDPAQTAAGAGAVGGEEREARGVVSGF